MNMAFSVAASGVHPKILSQPEVITISNVSLSTGTLFTRKLLDGGSSNSCVGLNHVTRSVSESSSVSSG